MEGGYIAACVYNLSYYTPTWLGFIQLHRPVIKRLVDDAGKELPKGGVALFDRWPASLRQLACCYRETIVFTLRERKAISGVTGGPGFCELCIYSGQLILLYIQVFLLFTTQPQIVYMLAFSLNTFVMNLNELLKTKQYVFKFQQQA